MSEAEASVAVVLLDTENLFKPFSHGPSNDNSERSARAFFGNTVDNEVSRQLGRQALDALRSWLANRFGNVDGRSYGKYEDRGVRTVFGPLIASDWVHVCVNRGKDKAELALNSDATSFALDKRFGTFVIGSGDKTALDKAVDLARTRDVVTILSASSPPPDRFEPGGTYETLKPGLQRLNRIWGLMLKASKKPGGPVLFRPAVLENQPLLKSTPDPAAGLSVDDVRRFIESAKDGVDLAARLESILAVIRNQPEENRPGLEMEAGRSADLTGARLWTEAEQDESHLFDD